MSRNINIQLFKEEDLSEVTYVNWTCLPENYTKSFFLNIYFRFPKTFFVASIDNKIVGYIMCRIETGLSLIKKFNITKKGHIISIAVLPEYRNIGIGQALLLETLKSMSSEYKVGECYLEVRQSNKAAINLYKKYAFEAVNVIKGYYRDGESANVMAVDLSKKRHNSSFRF